MGGYSGTLCVMGNTAAQNVDGDVCVDAMYPETFNSTQYAAINSNLHSVFGL